MIVLVEDDARFRELLSDFLTGLGHAVHDFASAEEALRFLSDLDLRRDVSERPRLLVTDQRMGRMSGLELARELRRRDPELPVILMTAFGERTLGGATRALGSSVYLEKPFSLAELAELTRKFLEPTGL